MRNRVVPVAARAAAMTSKLVLVMVLAPVALVALAQSASAATLADGLANEDVAATSVSFGLLGPVGIGAVVLGFGGLVVGLLRHRRRGAITAASTAATPAATSIVTLPVDSSGTLPVLEVAQPVEQAAAERVG